MSLSENLETIVGKAVLNLIQKEADERWEVITREHFATRSGRGGTIAGANRDFSR